MMRHISISKTAISVGTVFAAWHALWAVLIGLGWATRAIDFILELHFLKVDYQLAPFSAFTAFSLVAITFFLGALLGAIFAIVWNWLTAANAPEWARDTKRPSTTAS